MAGLNAHVCVRPDVPHHLSIARRHLDHLVRHLDELPRTLQSHQTPRGVARHDPPRTRVRSERAGQRVLASLKSFIERRLKLKVNSEKSKVAKPEERKFLSFQLFRLKSKDEVRIRIAEAALRRLESELKALTPRNWGQSLAVSTCSGDVSGR